MGALSCLKRWITGGCISYESHVHCTGPVQNESYQSGGLPNSCHLFLIQLLIKYFIEKNQDNANLCRLPEEQVYTGTVLGKLAHIVILFTDHLNEGNLRMVNSVENRNKNSLLSPINIKTVSYLFQENILTSTQSNLLS